MRHFGTQLLFSVILCSILISVWWLFCMCFEIYEKPEYFVIRYFVRSLSWENQRTNLHVWQKQWDLMAVNFNNFAQLKFWLPNNKCSQLMNPTWETKSFNRKRNIVLGFVLLIHFRVCNYKKTTLKRACWQHCVWNKSN